MSVGACCCGAFRPLPWSSWNLRAPSLCTNLSWTLRCCLEHLHPSLLLLGHSFAPLRACAGRTEHVSSAAPGRCSRISPWRGLVEGLECVPPGPVRRRLLARLLRSLSTWFRRVLTSPSLHCDFFRHLSTRRPRRESVLRTSLSHLPSASRAWHRVSVTFELLGLCCCPDVMSSSSGILSFAPSMANSTLNSAQFVCLLRCHHGSCFFMNCLFEQIDTVGVSARARDDVVHWQRS